MSILNMIKKAFTLIELLVVISIIGILVALSLFGFANARQNGRDAQRKSDLEQIRSALEFYKSEEGDYPTTGNLDDLETDYISSVPEDPISTQSYEYSSDGLTYTLCATLEDGSGDCSYQVENP